MTATCALARPSRPPDPPNETAARDGEFTAAAGRHSTGGRCGGVDHSTPPTRTRPRLLRCRLPAYGRELLAMRQRWMLPAGVIGISIGRWDLAQQFPSAHCLVIPDDVTIPALDLTLSAVSTSVAIACPRLIWRGFWRVLT